MLFSGFILALETPVHVGAGRVGMLAQAHGFVPGHVVSYALAARIALSRGGQLADFVEALALVQEETRCGPFLLIDPVSQRPLLPRTEREQIEGLFLTARNQISLDPEIGSAVESALFEVEAISARVLSGPQRGQPTRLAGGLWHRKPQLAGMILGDWFRHGLLLGGERKTGMGRVRCIAWKPNARHYADHKDWPVSGQGLHLPTRQILPGPSLQGTVDAPLQPWIGRLFDPQKGFGQRFSPPSLVRMDACTEAAAVFLPASTEVGLGCWTCAGDA